jgi:hypothetical protein
VALPNDDAQNKRPSSSMPPVQMLLFVVAQATSSSPDVWLPADTRNVMSKARA